MNTFSLVFLTVLAAGTALQCWLAVRHMRHVRAHRGQVPEAFHDRITPEQHGKAADYTVAKTRLSVVELGVGTVLLLLWTLGGGLDLLAHGWRTTGLGELTTEVAILVSAVLIMALLDLPLGAYQTFVIERRFGFNRTTPALFLVDTLKQGLLLLALGVPLAVAVIWLMGNAGALWWLYVWVLWMAFSLTLLFLYPVLIAPLFNRFTPLEDDALHRRIEALLNRNGFSTRGIFVMDGSRRSGHGNAYFTGIGANKRIVFFDTLLESLDADEVIAVLAHEVGHFKGRHVPKQVALAAATSLAGLALLGWLMGETWFYVGLGVGEPSLAVALLLFLLVVPVFTVFARPALAWLSRRHEFEADAFASRQADPRDLVRALVKLYSENASTLTPDPLYSRFHDSHPPAPVRVAHLTEASAG